MIQMTARMRGNSPTRTGTLIENIVPVVRAIRRVRFRASPGATVTVGKEFVVGPACRMTRGRTLVAGDRVSIGRDFECMTDAVIGDDVMISSSVAFIGNDHAFDDPTKTIRTQGLLPIATTRVVGDNLIGYGAIIIGDVTIGRGAIVGAGSLVTSDLPEYMVCVGRPAKPVRPRFEDRRPFADE
jgi:acetyltransferase-like isoleucine patch superfamily enzyme